MAHRLRRLKRSYGDLLHHHQESYEHHQIQEKLLYRHRHLRRPCNVGLYPLFDSLRQNKTTIFERIVVFVYPLGFRRIRAGAKAVIVPDEVRVDRMIDEWVSGISHARITIVDELFEVGWRILGVPG